MAVVRVALRCKWCGLRLYADTERDGLCCERCDTPPVRALDRMAELLFVATAPWLP